MGKNGQEKLVDKQISLSLCAYVEFCLAGLEEQKVISKINSLVFARVPCTFPALCSHIVSKVSADLSK